MNSGSMVDPSANSSEVSIQSTLPSFRAIKPSRLAAMWIVTRESIFAIAGVRSAPNDQSSAQQILDRFFQTLEVDRFCQVLGETSGAGFVHIVFHSDHYEEGWNAEGSKDVMWQHFKMQRPEVLRLLERIETWRMWVLCDREPIKE